MSRSVNSVTLLGNLVRDPELKTTSGGNSVVATSLALNRSYKDSSGEWQEATDFIDIVIWGKVAETVATYVKKGQRLYVSGRLSQRVWEKDGSKHSKVEVTVSEVVLLDKSKDDNLTDVQRQQKEMGTYDDKPINLDDIPF